MTRGIEEDDDERTIISTSFGDSDLPQFVSSSSMFNHTLPDGTRLGEFEIRGLIGEGGFGIVYLAYDLSLQRQVALKEYMPSSLAARSSTTATVSVKSDRHRETFQAGLKSFVNEARLLAQFNHPALVKVYRFWEDHGTAYMVMPYYEGPTLKRALAELGRTPTEAELMAWLNPLMAALEVMHAAHCFHRDIAPDNILLTDTGPLLLDFGAARRVIGDMTHALTVVLKPGYAPIEQYGEESTSMPQGAWTDIYALACVVYYAVTGKAPMSSVDRLIHDRLRPLSQIAADRYSPAFLHAIDTALSVRPEGRPQDIAQLRALLKQTDAAGGSITVPLDFMDTQPPEPPAQTIRPSAVATDPAPSPSTVGPSPVAMQPKARRSPVLAVAGVAVLIAVAVLAWWLLAKPRTSSAPVVPASPTTSAPAAPAPMVEPAASLPALVPEPLAAPASPAASSVSAPASQAGDAAPATQPPPVSKPKAKREPRSERLPQKMLPPPGRNPSLQARCSDILQKASLETLSPDETAFLKKECR